jgi:hypothetical protein
MVDLKEINKNGISVTYPRKAAEVQLVNDQTKRYISGEVSDTDFITLQCIKKAIKARKEFGIKEDNKDMANIQSDMRKNCLKGLQIGEVKEQLKCKSYGNRAIFYNPQLARNLIAEQKDAKKQKQMKERLDKIQALPDRAGYINTKK